MVCLDDAIVGVNPDPRLGSDLDLGWGIIWDPTLDLDLVFGEILLGSGSF